MRWLANLISALLVIIVVGLAPGVVRDSLADQKAKSDLAEINHIMYGIFSVNAWKGQISQIIFIEIRKIDLKSTTSKLKATIESQLSSVIDKLNEQIREANRSSLGGRIKQVLIDLVVDVEVVKKGVPQYADAILAQVNKPETEKLVKDLATDQLKKYLSKTFNEQKMAPVDAVLKRTGTRTVTEATAKLNGEIAARKKNLDTRSYIMIAMSVLLFAWVAIPFNRTGFSMATLFVALVTLLGVGVAIPMIDLEAKISEMSFMLIGHKVSFENQILYFQSKSVLDVFRLMITHHDIKMQFVGVLLVLFSVVFPVLKMAASLFFYYTERFRKNRVIRYLAFKTGKWSMADVMVIAILMAYIGFNGIVETQFSKMASLVPKDISFFTTNGTTFQMGYYIFVAYAVLALFLAVFVEARESSHLSEAETGNR